MPSVLALISKVEFARLGADAAPGRPLDLTCYRSRHASLDPLASGGDLYLVTVRPEEALWLVAVLRRPRLTKKGWQASEPNTQPFVSAKSIAKKLKFSTGNGVSRAAGKLGMSLQTPRTLTDGDVALFAGLSGAGAETRRPPPAVDPPKLDRAGLDDVLVRLLARLLQRSEEDIRADESRYAAFHSDDSTYDLEAGWIDWTSLTVAEDGDDGSDDDGEAPDEEDEDLEDQGNDNLYARRDFDFARSLFHQDEFNHSTCTDKSLRSLLARQDDTLYGAQIQALVAQGRLDPDRLVELSIEGRIDARGDSLLDAARALFKLDRFGQEAPLRPGPYSKVEKGWKKFLAEIAPTRELRDHLGIFFQTANAARCSGAAPDGDPGYTLLDIDGTPCFEVVTGWSVGEGQGGFYLVRIHDDAVPPVPAFEGRLLIRRRDRSIPPASAAEGSSRSLADRLAPYDAVELGLDGDKIATVADFRRRVGARQLAAFMKPIGGSSGKMHPRAVTIAQCTHLLLEARAADAALAVCEAAAPHLGDDLRALVLYNMGVALTALQRYPEALAVYEQAMAAAGRSASWAQVPSSQLHNNLAWVAFKAGRIDVARAHIPTALEADPENMDAQGTAGCIALASGKTEEAMKYFATAMASGHDPDPGVDVAKRGDYRELALRFGIPIELTDEEAAMLGPEGYIDEVDPDSDDDYDEDDDDDD